MLSNGFDKPLLLKRKTSHLLIFYLVGIHVLALLALLQPIALPPAAMLVLWFILLTSVGVHARYIRRQRDNTDNYWVWQTNGMWQRVNADQTYLLVPSKSVSTPWFVAATLTTPAREKQRLLLVCDQLDADSFRRLRVRMHLYYDKAVAGSADSE
jgi:hypothetical protein